MALLLPKRVKYNDKFLGFIETTLMQCNLSMNFTVEIQTQVKLRGVFK